MNKKVYQQALERSQSGLCEVYGCNSNNSTQLHHIIKGKGKRTQCERIESVLFVCWEHHHGNKGIHGKDGHELDLKLKLDLQQRYFDMGMAEEEVRRWMGGRLY